MLSPIRLLRLLIETGDASSYEAKRLAQDVGNMIPEGPERDKLTAELQDTLDVLHLADIAGTANPSVERAQALRALDAIERRLRH